MIILIIVRVSAYTLFHRTQMIDLHHHFKWHLGYAGDPFDQRRGCEVEPCSTGPCGTNAECSSNGRTAICKVFVLSLFER